MRRSATPSPRLLFIAVALSVASAKSAPAAVVSWGNPAGGAWGTAANWSPVGVPGSADDVKIDLPGSYTVTVTGAINIRSLTVGAPSGSQTITGTSTITTSSPSGVAAGSTGATLRTITLGGAGGFTVPAGSALTLQGCTVGSSLVNNGTLVLTGTGSVSGIFTSGVGSTLRLRGSSAVGGVTQTFSTGFTNNGLLELTSTDANWAASLLVSSGALVNAPTRTIDVQAGTGGARTLTARLDNQGVITLGAVATVNKSAVAHTNSGTIAVTGGDLTLTLSGGGCSFTNSGTLDVSVGRTLSVAGGTFTHNAGSLGPGALSLTAACTANLAAEVGLTFIALNGATLNLTPALSTADVALTCTSSTLNGPGVLTNAAGVTLTATGSTLAAPLVNAGTLVLAGTGSVNGAYTSQPGSILRVTGTSALGGAVQTFANGFTNNGTVELTSSGSAWSSVLQITSGALTNPATRTIDVLAGSGGTRTLGARLDNQGTVLVNAPFTLAKSGAAHVNSGAFDASGADVTLSLAGAGGSFTNTGAITLAAARTLTATSGAFRHDGGSLGPAGALSFGSGCVASLGAPFSVSSLTGVTSTISLTPSISTNAVTLSATNTTLNGPGTITNSAGITLTLAGCVVHAPLANDGILVLTGTGSVQGAFTTGAGSVLRIPGTNSATGAAQTFAGGFTNNGTIELTSSGSSWSSALHVTEGILLNPPGRTIDVQPGTGGTRTLNARLDNRGQLSLGTALAVSKPGAAHSNSGTLAITGGDLALTMTGGSFTNTGAITLASGRTLTVNSGTFSHDAGSLGSAGALTLAGGCTANLAAPFTLTSLTVTSSSVHLTPGLSTAATVVHATGSTIGGPGLLTNAAGVTTTLTGCTLNAPVVNDGTLVLAGTGAVSDSFTSSAGSTLRVQGSSTGGAASQAFATGFTNNGTLELTSSGSAWPATLLVTSGTLVNPPGRVITALPGAGGQRTIGASLENQGTVNVNAPLNLSTLSGALVNSGTLSVAAADLSVTLGSAGATFTNTGSISLPAGRTFQVSGGQFRHESGSIGASGTLRFLLGATAHLLAPFDVSALSLSGSTLHLDSALATADLLFTADGSTIHGPGTLTNSVNLSLTLPNCTVNGPLVNLGTLVLTGSGSVNGAFTSGAGSTLRVSGTSTLGAATQTFALGFTNNGTVELASTGAAAAATLGVTAGTLLNPPARLIDILGGLGGARSLNAQIDNAGTLHAGTAFTLHKPGAVHLNSGAIQVNGGNLTIVQSGAAPAFRNLGSVEIAAGRTLLVDGGSFVNDTTGTLQGGGTINVLTAALSNDGMIRPGSSPGLLRVTGALAMGATSRTIVELGGATAGSGFDRLAVTGALALDGSLELSLVNGFAPAAGQAFPILAGGPRTGRFASISGIPLGGGLSLEPQYSDSGVVLHVVAQTWVRQLPHGAAPAAREGHAAVFDPASRRMIVFGGRTASGAGNDVHVLTHADGGGEPEWLALAADGVPPAARWHHSAAYDARSNTLIVVGGDDGAGAPAVFGDIWLLSHANGLGGTPQWSELAASGGPGARTGAAVAYDAAGKRLLLFGGSATAACGSSANDAWVLGNADGSGTSVWTALAAAGVAPPARAHARAGYDPIHNRLVVFGGQSACSTGSSSLWALTNANGFGGPPVWDALAPSGAAPASVSLQAVAYEPVSDRLTVFGGTADSTYEGALCTLFAAGGAAATPAWTSLGTSGVAPSGRAGASAVQGADRVVLFGGRTASGLSAELFTLETDAGRVLDVPPDAVPAARPAGTAFARAPAPNPSAGVMRFTVDVADPQRVELAVLDLAGRRVASLQRGFLPSGTHAFTWSGVMDSGVIAPAGVYFVQLRATGVKAAQRVLRVR